MSTKTTKRRKPKRKLARRGPSGFERFIVGLLRLLGALKREAEREIKDMTRKPGRGGGMGGGSGQGRQPREAKGSGGGWQPRQSEDRRRPVRDSDPSLPPMPDDYRPLGWDGKPVTSEADRRFFWARENGYDGPIDRNGYPVDEFTTDQDRDGEADLDTDLEGQDEGGDLDSEDDAADGGEDQ